jgi:hypothetical protein
MLPDVPIISVNDSHELHGKDGGRNASKAGSVDIPANCVVEPAFAAFFPLVIVATFVPYL